MAKSCSTCGEKFQGQCDACRLVDGDFRIKSVFHCADCNAYLCATCSDNWVKRPVAASIQFVNNITDKISNYWNLKFGKTDNVIIIAETTTTINDNLSYSELKAERKRLLKKRNQSTIDEKEKGEIFTALLAIDEKIKAIYSALPTSTKGGGDYNRDLNSEQTNNFLS